MNSVPLIIGVRIPMAAGFRDSVSLGIIDYVRAVRPDWQLQIHSGETSGFPFVCIDESWRGAGLISFQIGEEEKLVFESAGISLVNISSLSIASGVPTVVPDDHGAGVLAAKHLLDLGFQHVAYWGDRRLLYSREQERGFVGEVEAAGKHCVVENFDARAAGSSETWSRVEGDMRRSLQALSKPLGIFAMDDFCAHGLLEQCKALGLRVPQEVAVLGYNDDPVHSHTAYPPLSTVLYPGRELGYVAASILHRQMVGGEEEVPGVTKVPVTEIIQRESTDVLVFEDEVVSRAVAIIRREAGYHQLQISELIARLHVSRSGLHAKFKRVLGTSPKELIDKTRNERLSLLLGTTQMQIKEIGFEMGFRSLDELGRFCKRMNQRSPGELRREFREAHPIQRPV